MPHESFHIHLYGISAGGPPNASQPATPIPTSFEAAERRLLERMPNALFEPDGSFAWASVNHQVVGMIYDAGGAVQYIELRGHCSQEQIRQLVQTLCGTEEVDELGVMVLPNRQWKIFHSFEKSFPSGDHSAANE